MKLHWYGHASFLLTNDLGKTLLLDPFNEKVGYPIPEYAAELVLVSHGHYDHANVTAVKSEFSLIRHVGEFSLCGYRIKRSPCFHDDQQGALRGQNIISVIEADGQRVCHMGDIGHELTPELVKEIGQIDFLLLPVGGGYTVDAETACRIAEVIAPKHIIPMHYKTDSCILGIGPADAFLAHFAADAIRHTDADLSLAEVEESARVLMMAYQS